MQKREMSKLTLLEEIYIFKNAGTYRCTAKEVRAKVEKTFVFVDAAKVLHFSRVSKYDYIK